MSVFLSLTKTPISLKNISETTKFKESDATTVNGYTNHAIKELNPDAETNKAHRIITTIISNQRRLLVLYNNFAVNSVSSLNTEA